jgi:8-oxo-dGTP pyrophosphatase MutT (NUDIX family)
VSDVLQGVTPLSKLPDFDPRRVPVESVDRHLPAVQAKYLDAAAMRARFDAPPVWKPELSTEPRYSDRSSVVASVLVPIVMRAQPTVLLTQRTGHLSTHSGQIAFPGGKHDPQDVDLVTTALREAREEVGLSQHFVHVLGALPVYVTGSAFVITPVVALVRDGFTLERNVNEVDDIFEVPLQFLMDPANHRWHRYEAQGVSRHWISMPFHDGRSERYIWGATAGMLRNLYRFLVA